MSDLVRGFTLVETLVAVSILSLAIVATFTAVQNGLQSSTIAKDQTIAFYMAQEGMELIRNRRDQNALFAIAGASTGWLSGMSDVGDPCYFGNTCRVDGSTGIFTNCGGSFGSCPNIGQDSTTGRYGYAYTATNFKREIQFESVNTNEVKIHMNISWVSRGVSRSFQVTESMFNHQ